MSIKEQLKSARHDRNQTQKDAKKLNAYNNLHQPTHTFLLSAISDANDTDFIYCSLGYSSDDNTIYLCNIKNAELYLNYNNFKIQKVYDIPNGTNKKKLLECLNYLIEFEEFSQLISPIIPNKSFDFVLDWDMDK